MRRLAGLLVAGAILAGCAEQSRVDPEATITVQGLVTDTDGSPLAGRPVKLGAGISDSEGAFAVLTLGLSCTSGECRGAVRDTTTDDAGNYAFTLQGHETQSTFGEAVGILVSATGETPNGHVSGALVSARFRVQAETVTVPALGLVDPGLAVEGAADVTARWSTARPPPYALTFETDASTPVWRVETADSATTIDTRLLEDTAGRVVLSGGHTETVAGSDAEVTWRSPGRGYVAGAGPPPSRGRACRYVDVDGTGHSAVASPCELTDGDFAGFASEPPVCAAGEGGTTTCASATAVEIQLGEAVPGELVVVRGCEGGCGVEVSGDGTTFRPAGAASDDFGVVGLDGQPITVVRVGLGTGSFGLREASVWGPRPDRPALRSLSEAARDDLGEPFDGGRGSGRPSIVLIAFAIALGAVTLVGLGFTLGRRKARDAIT